MESTLALQYKDLLAETGLFLGFGRGEEFGDTAWTTQQQAAIESCVKSGLRNFYWPPPVEGTPSSYDWSFLKPTASLALVSGQSAIQLPDDFGGFDGPLTVLTSKLLSFFSIGVEDRDGRRALVQLLDHGWQDVVGRLIDEVTAQPGQLLERVPSGFARGVIVGRALDR